MTETRAKRVVVCATGGYEVYALPGFILALLQHVADDVQVVLSRAATRLVSLHAVEVASRRKVFVEMDDQGEDVFVPHIELGRGADLILVYPATVNVVGKVANGIADELIPALILAAHSPVLFVPVANPHMWTHPAVKRNLDQLKADGYAVAPPPAAIEVATREGLETMGDFPHPTLLLRMRALLKGHGPGSPVRGPVD